MARWLVTQRDRQFTAKDLAELQQLAQQGQLGAGDMIQPPGASDWLYAVELPELKDVIKRDTSFDDDEFPVRRGIPNSVLAIVALLIIGAGGFVMYDYAQKLQATDLELLGGENGLQLTELLVTEEGGAPLYSTPEGGSAATTLPHNAKLQLLSKRKDRKVEGQPRQGRYQIRAENGAEGWVATDTVIPGYQFADEKTQKDYDPIYNPDRYVFVKNSSWMQLPNQQEKNTTLFQFLLQNKSKFEMTDLVLIATIKDKNDRVLEGVEIPIEGSIAPYSSVEVGTLMPEELEDPTAGLLGGRMMTTRLFNDLSKEDPDLSLRWSVGVEVQMDSEGFVEANIDLLELRAIPKKLD